MDLSFEIVTKISAKLLEEGNRVFSPITLGHCVAKYLPKEKLTDSKFWTNLFLPEMKDCDILLLVVLVIHKDIKYLVMVGLLI